MHRPSLAEAAGARASGSLMSLFMPCDASPCVSVAPHAPAYAREYTQTLFVGVQKRCRVPWRLPGTVWLWSTKPQHVQCGTDRLDLDPQGAGRAGWAGGKIPIVFPPYETPCFKTVDVVISSAPPEFSNARKYVLRFHLTYIDPTSHACAPKEVDSTELAAEAQREHEMTKVRLDQLERMAATERLMQLNKQCAELQAQRLSSPAAPPFAPCASTASLMARSSLADQPSFVRFGSAASYSASDASMASASASS